MTQSEVGKYCKFLRENSGLTQKALADILDLPKSRINSLENGKAQIREYEIKSYSQLFDVPQSQFTIYPKKQVVEEKRYILANILHQLKDELGIKYFPVNDICNKTGIGKKRFSNVSTRKDCGATEQEVELIAGYFGKDKEFFMTEPKVVKLITEKRVDISENEKKEEEPTVTLNIKDAPTESTITTKANDTDIWRDKAHELHRELGEARREIERLKSDGASEADQKALDTAKKEVNEWHNAYDDLFKNANNSYNELLANYEASQNELEEIRSNNKELGRRVENLAIENANLTEENDNLLKDYEASQNDNKELINRIDEIIKERDANDDLQAKYDALKAECDKYKEIILKVVVKAAELLLEKY